MSCLLESLCQEIQYLWRGLNICLTAVIVFAWFGAV